MVQNMEEKWRTARVEADRLFEEAKSMTGGVSPADVEFEKFKTVFHAFGDTEEEVDRQIQDTQARADCLGKTDETVS
jgi:hypothetical protein